MSASRAERVYLELVRQHQAAILGFIWRRVGDHPLAEDLTQETFVKAWRALGRLELADDAADRRRAWLYRIARNTVTDHMRRRARLQWLSLDAVRERGGGDPSGSVAQREPVQRALAALDPDQREVLLLFGHIGMSAVEVGEVLGISEVAARKRRQRAKAAFEAHWNAIEAAADVADADDTEEDAEEGRAGVDDLAQDMDVAHDMTFTSPFAVSTDTDTDTSASVRGTTRGGADSTGDHDPSAHGNRNGTPRTSQPEPSPADRSERSDAQDKSRS